VYSKDASSAQSVAVQGFLDKIASFFGITLQLNQQVVRNLAHLLEFFVLGVEIALYGTYGRSPVRQDLFHMTAAVFAVGFMDETLQIFFQRGPMIADVWLDFVGGISGMLLVFAVYFIKNASKKRRH
jgi:VanZ family protein